MKTNFNTDEIKVVLHRLMFAVTTFIKWLACSVVCGVVLGLIGTFFYKLLGLVTVFRETNPWILFGLPVAGLLIVFRLQLTVVFFFILIILRRRLLLLLFLLL